jgi:CRP-like cAMP-binding protein
MDIHTLLSKFNEVSQDTIANLNQQLSNKTFKKGQIILSQGMRMTDLIFVKKGIQMLFVHSNTKEIIIAFTYPPNIITVPGSFSFDKPSKYTIKAITDTELAVISRESLENIFDKDSSLERTLRKIQEHVMSGVLERLVDHRILTIEQRYIQFMQRSAFLLKSVPHKYLASYLGMDHTNFSKMYNHIKI